MRGSSNVDLSLIRQISAVKLPSSGADVAALTFDQSRKDQAKYGLKIQAYNLVTFLCKFLKFIRFFSDASTMARFVLSPSFLCLTIFHWLT